MARGQGAVAFTHDAAGNLISENADRHYEWDAFEYGAPPHGGIALGFDRLCSLFGGADSIRDFIAFPKNNSGRDVMIDAPSPIFPEQLDELYLEVKPLKD